MIEFHHFLILHRRPSCRRLGRHSGPDSSAKKIKLKEQRLTIYFTFLFFRNFVIDTAIHRLTFRDLREHGDLRRQLVIAKRLNFIMKGRAKMDNLHTLLFCTTIFIFNVLCLFWIFKLDDKVTEITTQKEFERSYSRLKEHTKK